MIKYMRSHLTVKIFLITTLLFLAIAAVTYGFIVFSAPKYYILEAEKMSAVTEPGAMEPGDMEQENREPVDGKRRSFSSVISLRTDGDTAYTLEIRENARMFSATLQNVFLPLLILVICTALISALFYSRYITRPVIRITEASKKLAALDFGVQCRENRKDEIGMLADNLNELSGRLSLALEELKNANLRLQQDVEREKELENRQLAFFSAVSHELKTPITILKGQLQGMLCQVGGYKDRDKYLKRSFEVTCSMEKLVMEILTVTRMKSSGFSAQIENFDLTALISEILEDYEELFSGKKLEIVTEMEPGKMISADKRLFAKVISNLLSNAYHYSPDGEQVHIQAEDTPQGVQCSVENTGVHIPEQEIPGLFDAFTRREQSRNRETGGSGLGLTIVAMVLELHQFSYSMENTADGMRFRILCRNNEKQ